MTIRKLISRITGMPEYDPKTGTYLLDNEIRVKRVGGPRDRKDPYSQ